ncbi:hypothetical protein K1719_019915 [Acacia pycnantha]|nr:hypothetical protein K1719_019915 [Acacia pycnantha]
MAIAVVFFFSGTRLYRQQKPGGSPLTRILQVVVASLRKRKVEVLDDKRLLYEVEFEDKQEYDRVLCDSPLAVNGYLLNLKPWLPVATIDSEGSIDEQVHLLVDLAKPLVAGVWVPRSNMDKVWAIVKKFCNERRDGSAVSGYAFRAR